MLKSIQDALVKYGKDLYIMYNSENSDKFFVKYISSHLSTSSICIIAKNKVYVLVHELDSKNVSKLKYNSRKIEIYVYNNSRSLDAYIEDIIANLKFPKNICFNYSTMSDSNVDILTYGQYNYLTKLVKRPYKKYNKKVKITSAEKVIYEVASQKTNLQIKRLKYLASLTDEILKKTFSKIRINDTEIDIKNKTLKITDEIMQKEKSCNKDIISFDVAWENAPIVLTGINLKKGGHSLASSKKLGLNETIYFDFGLKVTFSDNETLYTDIQRMRYSKKEKDEVPSQVMDVFNTLKNSIEEGMEKMKPGIKAYKIDNIVRGKILGKKYPDYNHATGHPVGLNVHDIGAIISIRNSKRSNLDLVENGIYTLEPRIAIENGGSIEEMIQVTKYGGVSLCNVQDKLYIVNQK